MSGDTRMRRRTNANRKRVLLRECLKTPNIHKALRRRVVQYQNISKCLSVFRIHDWTPDRLSQNLWELTNVLSEQEFPKDAAVDSHILQLRTAGRQMFVSNSLAPSVRSLCRTHGMYIVLGSSASQPMEPLFCTYQDIVWFPWWDPQTFLCADPACGNIVYGTKERCDVCKVVFCNAQCHNVHDELQCGFCYAALTQNNEGPVVAERHNQLFPPTCFMGIDMKKVIVVR